LCFIKNDVRNSEYIPQTHIISIVWFQSFWFITWEVIYLVLVYTKDYTFDPVHPSSVNPVYQNAHTLGKLPESGIRWYCFISNMGYVPLSYLWWSNIQLSIWGHCQRDVALVLIYISCVIMTLVCCLLELCSKGHQIHPLP